MKNILIKKKSISDVTSISIQESLEFFQGLKFKGNQKLIAEEVLKETDVLTWWGHAAHNQVEDRIVDRVQERVLQGMGLIVLHSAHYSKIFRRLMGTTCSLIWREAGEMERV